MAFQNNAELVNRAVQALAANAPPDWRKIIFYLEYLEDEKIGLRNKFTGRVLGGEKLDIRLDGYGLSRSMEALDSIEALYLKAAHDGDRWAGIRLTIFPDGQFKCNFYYDSTPLLGGDEEAVEQIMSDGMSNLPTS